MLERQRVRDLRLEPWLRPVRLSRENETHGPSGAIRSSSSSL